MRSEGFARAVLVVVGEASLRSLFLLAAVGLTLLCLRRASAALRHLVLLLALGGLLCLPLLSAILPAWKVTLPLRPVPTVSPTASPTHLPESTGTQTASALPPGPAPDSPPASPSPLAAPSLPHSQVPPAWPACVVAGWLAGAAASLVPLLMGMIAVRRLARRCAPLTDGDLSALLSRCGAELGIRRRVTLLQGTGEAGASVPMTWGLLPPTVLLPVGAEAWPAERQRAVLLHELAHVRRGDWLWQMLGNLVCALYWFHPGAWWLVHQMRGDSERACDDMVLAAGVPALDYAKHLAYVARSLSAPKESPSVVLPMALSSHMEGRVRSILQAGRIRNVMTRRSLTIALLLALAALAPVASLRPIVKAQTVPRVAPSLSGGLPVELAGITYQDGTRGPWWAASGVPLTSALFPLTREQFIGRKAKGTSRPIVFAFRLPPSARDVTTKFDLPQSLHFSSRGTWTAKTLGLSVLSEAKISGGTGGCRTLTAFFPVSLSKTDIRVGVASGPWTLAATQYARNDWFGAAGTSAAGTFIFSPITHADGDEVVTITSSGTPQDIRIVGVDDRGQRWLPKGVGDQSSNGVTQITAQFTLGAPSRKLAEVRVETRPFHWATFQDVALQAGVPPGTVSP